jgi:hypothetical protein
MGGTGHLNLCEMEKSFFSPGNGAYVLAAARGCKISGPSCWRSAHVRCLRGLTDAARRGGRPALVKSQSPTAPACEHFAKKNFLFCESQFPVRPENSLF